MLELVIPGYTVLYWNLLYFLGQLFKVKVATPIVIPPEQAEKKEGSDKFDFFYERNPRKHELF